MIYIKSNVHLLWSFLLDWSTLHISWPLPRFGLTPTITLSLRAGASTYSLWVDRNHWPCHLVWQFLPPSFGWLTTTSWILFQNPPISIVNRAAGSARASPTGSPGLQRTANTEQPKTQVPLLTSTLLNRLVNKVLLSPSVVETAVPGFPALCDLPSLYCPLLWWKTWSIHSVCALRAFLLHWGWLISSRLQDAVK